MSDLANRLRELRAKATPGEWDTIEGCNDSAPSNYCRHVGPKNSPALWAYWNHREGNCAFVQFCANNALSLAAELERLEAENAELKVMVEYHNAYHDWIIARMNRNRGVPYVTEADVLQASERMQRAKAALTSEMNHE